MSDIRYITVELRKLRTLEPPFSYMRDDLLFDFGNFFVLSFGISVLSFKKMKFLSQLVLAESLYFSPSRTGTYN